MNHYDVVIVGAGQAGIAMGYYLKQTGTSFLLLESNKRIGDSWRQRYESLVLFTPRKYSSLPGLQMNGLAGGFPTKDEIADYLEQYVTYFDLPVKLNTKVLNIRNDAEIFEIETDLEMIKVKQVVIASGAFQKPFIPPIVTSKEPEAFQMHSSSYLSPNQILNNSVLIVGGGNSGAQIAVELAHMKNVTLAVSRPFKFLPLQFLGKSIFDWLDFIGLLYAGVYTKKGSWFRRQQDPIFGKELKRLIHNGKINIKPKVVKVEGNEVLFEDNSMEVFENIIWSTGFVPDYNWILIDGVTKSNGEPIHKRGISPVKGLYFIGLPWQYQRGSALICGVGRDAKYLVPYIMEAK